jgi:hypothetical protein
MYSNSQGDFNISFIRNQAIENIMKLHYLIITLIILVLLGSCDVFPLFSVDDVYPENTMMPTSGQTATSVPMSTSTPYPSDTPAPPPMQPTSTHTIQNPTATPEEPVDNGPDDQETHQFSYDLQPGSPLRIHAWSHGCEWLGVAGQVFNHDGEPVKGLIVEAGGKLAGEDVLGLSITGMNELYGPGGYEIQFHEKPVTSSKTVWIQLKDSSGLQFSEKIYLELVDDCNQNLIILNFLEINATNANALYFPLIKK